MQVGPENKVCVFGRRAESKVDTHQHQPHGVSCGVAKTVGMRNAITLVPEQWQPKDSRVVLVRTQARVVCREHDDSVHSGAFLKMC